MDRRNFGSYERFKGDEIVIYRIMVWGGGGGLREHEGQPVLEAEASVYRLGPRCRTQARCTTYK